MSKMLIELKFFCRDKKSGDDTQRKSSRMMMDAAASAIFVTAEEIIMREGKYLEMTKMTHHVEVLEHGRSICLHRRILITDPEFGTPNV